MNPQPCGTEVAIICGIDVILSFIVGTPSGPVFGCYGIATSPLGEDISAIGPLGPTGKGDSDGCVHFGKPDENPRDPLSRPFTGDDQDRPNRRPTFNQAEYEGAH